MRLLPQRLVDVMRKFTDVSLDVFGIDCTLYVPNNLTDSVENSDIYIKPADLGYTKYFTKVWIEWSPNKHRLRKLGVFMEDETPIIAWFGNTVTDGFGNEIELDVCVRSYFAIAVQYIPNKAMDTEEFEIVDVLIPAMADKLVRKCFKIAPRRIKGANPLNEDVC